MPTSFFRSTAAVAAVGVGALTLLSAPAAAQTCYPPTEGCVTTSSSTPTAGPNLTLSSTTVARGQRVGAAITGFPPGSSGILTIASVEQQIGTFTMPATGAANSQITIPTNISLGAHTVFARGTINGTAASASRAVTVVGSTTISGNGNDTSSRGSTSNLARTGFYLVPASVIGLGLVAGGVALRRSGKRKSRTEA